jgi:hypothetical protein
MAGLLKSRLFVHKVASNLFGRAPPRLDKWATGIRLNDGFLDNLPTAVAVPSGWAHPTAELLLYAVDARILAVPDL